MEVCTFKGLWRLWGYWESVGSKVLRKNGSNCEETDKWWRRSKPVAWPVQYQTLMKSTQSDLFSLSGSDTTCTEQSNYPTGPDKFSECISQPISLIRNARFWYCVGQPIACPRMVAQYFLFVLLYLIVGGWLMNGSRKRLGHRRGVKWEFICDLVWGMGY